MKEATALLRLQHGKEDALAWFIDRYSSYVCTVIRYIIGGSMTEEDVEETASDVFQRESTSKEQEQNEKLNVI